MARSDAPISAIFASSSLSPSAPAFAAFSSCARAFIAARSSVVNPLDFLFLVVVVLFAAMVTPLMSLIRCSPVLNQPEDIAVGVGHGGHQTPAADVARRLLRGGARSCHFGQLRLDVGHVPVGDR